MAVLEYLTSNSLVSYPFKPRKEPSGNASHPISDDWFYDILFTSFSDTIRSVYLSKIKKTNDGSLEISFSSVETEELLGIATVAASLVTNHYKNLSKSFASYSCSSFAVKFVFGPGLVEKSSFEQEYLTQESELANSAVVLNKPAVRTIKFEALEFDANTSNDVSVVQVRTYNYPDVPVVKPNHNSQFVLDSLNNGSLYVLRGAGAGLYDACPKPGQIEDVYSLNLVSPDSNGALFLKPSSCYTANTLTESAKTLLGNTLDKYENFKTLSNSGDAVFKDVVHIGHSITFENFCKPKCPHENLNAFAHYLNRVSDGAQELDTLVARAEETRGKGSSVLKVFTADEFCVSGDDVFARCSDPADPSTHIACGDTFIKNYHEGRTLQLYYTSLVVRNYTIVEVIDTHRVRLSEIPPQPQQGDLLSFRVLDNGVIANLNCAALAYNEDAANFLKTYYKVAYATNECYNADGVYVTNIAVIVSLYNPAPVEAQVKVNFQPNSALTRVTNFKVRTAEDIYTLDEPELVLSCREYASIEAVFAIPCETDDGALSIAVSEKVSLVWTPVGEVYHLPKINGAPCPGSVTGNQGGAIKYRIIQSDWQNFDKFIDFPDDVLSVSSLYGTAPSWLIFTPNPTGDNVRFTIASPPTTKESVSYNLYFRSYGAVTTIWQVILNYVALPEILAPLASRFSDISPLLLSKESIYTADNPVLQVVATNMQPLSQDPPANSDIYTYKILNGSLPPGLVLNSSTGKITGQLDPTLLAGASFNALLTAQNPAGEALDPQLIYFKIAVEFPPELSLISPPVNEVYITSNLETHTINSPLVSFSVLNGPVYGFELSGDLPRGLYFDTATGSITGRISASTPASVDLFVTASNVYGQSNTVSFTITYALFAAPQITSPSESFVIEASAKSESTLNAPLFTLEALQAFGGTDNFDPALNDATRNYYVASGGPPGFTLDYYTGKFYGVLASSELKPSESSYSLTYPLRIGAYNPVGSASRTIFIKLYSAQVPVILNITTGFTLNAAKEVTYNLSSPLYRFTVLNSPTAFTATGLPAGLTCTSSGIIVGTIAKTVAAGSYSFTVKAENSSGESTPVTGTIIVPVSIISPVKNAEYFVTVGAVSSTIFGVTTCAVLSGDQITLTAENLPIELTFINGVVEGALTVPGVYFIKIIASTSLYGSASVVVKLVISTGTYTVSGKVTDNQGTPVPDVLLALGQGKTAVNDSVTGAYTITGVYPGSYNVFATSATHKLIPSFQSVDVGLSNTIGVDFIAELPTRFVKGTIRDSEFAGISGVVVSDGVDQATTDSFGVYTLYISQTGTVAVTPSSSAYVFNPPSWELPDGTDYEGADFSAITSKVTSAPTITTITSGNAELVVAFTAPEDAGGTDITNYEYSVNSGLDWISLDPAQTTSPITITFEDALKTLPLVNGTNYGVSVRAVNLSGPGVPSFIIFATPATTAPTPTIVSHEVNGTSASIVFTLPTNTSGAKVSSIEYSLDEGVSYAAATSTVSPLTLENLTVGDTYGVILRAVNSKGAGTPSAKYSFEITSPPEPPNILNIVAQDSQLSVNFELLVAPGGLPISNVGYSVDGGATFTYPDPASIASPLVITNLTNGTLYRVVLAAINSVGAYSDVSAVVLATPTELPDAPTDLVAAPLIGSLSISFTPSTNSFDLIQNYKYQLDDGDWIPLSPARFSSPITIPGLTNGTQYAVKIRAVVAAGDGIPSGAVQGTPAKPASAPKLTSITAFQDSLEVFFKKSEDLGGSTLLNYSYSIDGGKTYVVATITDIPPDSGKFTISSLVTGTKYSVSLKARTTVGLGEVSNSLSATPITTPSAPSQLTVVPGDKAATVSFTAPTSSGGAIISNYKYQLNSDAWQARTPASNATVLTIKNLVNGKFYYLKLKAVNAAGDGAESESVSFVPATTPSAPTITKIYGREKRLQIIFTAPASDGGSFITGYQYSVDGGLTFRESNEHSTGAIQGDSPEAPYIIIDKLVNGTTYAVVLRAINYVGAGAASSAVTGKPVGTPPAPTIVSASSTPNGASIRFTPPASDGGAAITNYAYSVKDSSGNEKTVTNSPVSTTSPINISNLPLGETAIIKICAVNSAGNGAFSSEVSVVPGAPAAPTINSLTGIDSALIVRFTPAASTSGAPATGYEYSVDSGVTYFKIAGTASPFTIPNLINETSYNVQMRAFNAVSNSAPSNIVRGQPTNVPSAPTITGVSSHEGLALMYFTPPVNDGGLPILGYKYSLDGVVFTSAGSTTSPLSLLGLNVGTTYNLYIKAFNVSGDGVTSAAFSVTIGTPAAPTIDVISATSTSVALTFTLPEDGGAPLLNIEYSLNGSSSWTSVNPPITESPLILSNALTANTRYSINIRATNARGPGTPSNTVYIAKGLDDAPQISSIRPENGTLTLNILPPGNHTQAITDYKYNVYSDTDTGVYLPFNASTFPITSLTIPI